MKKARWSIVFALLAAFAFVFAAGCDNSGDSDYAGTESDYASGNSDYASTESDYANGGDSNYASGDSSYANGDSDYASGDSSYANGDGDYANGDGDYANGDSDYANGDSDYAGTESDIEQDVVNDDYSNENPADTDSPNDSDGNAQATAITADDVTLLLQKIDAVIANSFAESTCYWDFAKGTLDSDAEDGPVFSPPLFNTSAYLPARKTTLSSMNGKGTISTDILTVSLSDINWEIPPSATKSLTKGTFIIAIELTDAAKDSHAIPKSLESVTIVMEASEWMYNK